MGYERYAESPGCLIRSSDLTQSQLNYYTFASFYASSTAAAIRQQPTIYLLRRTEEL